MTTVHFPFISYPRLAQERPMNAAYGFRSHPQTQLAACPAHPPQLATTLQRQLGEVLVFHSALATNSVGSLKPLAAFSPLSLVYMRCAARIGRQLDGAPKRNVSVTNKREGFFPPATEQKQGTFFVLKNTKVARVLTHHHPSVRSGRLVL